MNRALALGAALAVFVLGACGGDGNGDETAGGQEPVGVQASRGEPEGKSPEGRPKERSGAPAKPGIAFTTQDSEYGTVLFDEDDRAIYLFDKETSDASECYGACAEAWPPVVTDGDPEAKGEVRASLLGTTERKDGSTQVTYDGRPLYYYHDEPRGQILCQNVDEFGGLWLVVQPSGAPVT